MDISKFLEDSTLVKTWLDEEKNKLEPDDLFLSYWFHDSGIGITVTADASGEFHAMKSGQITMHIEKSDGSVLHSQNSETNDDAVMRNMFDKFKSIIHQST